jgi:hypothetical protein
MLVIIMIVILLIPESRNQHPASFQQSNGMVLLRALATKCTNRVTKQPRIYFQT